MKAGELRHRVLIQKPSKEQLNDDGFNTNHHWIDYKKLSAKITHLSSNDLRTAQAEMSKVVARMKIRYRTDIDTTMRVIWKGRIFAIDSQAMDDNITGNTYCTFNLSGGVEQFAGD